MACSPPGSSVDGIFQARILEWVAISCFPATAAKSLQSCPTLCDPIDGSPPGSPVPGILQARTLEWGAISFFNASKWKVKVKSLSRVQPSATWWTAAFQAPPSMGFYRQEYWSGVPLPSPHVSLVTCIKDYFLRTVLPALVKQTQSPTAPTPSSFSSWCRPERRPKPPVCPLSGVRLQWFPQRCPW